MQPPQSAALGAQQAAIAQARARYERGELTFEAFRRALDALVLARTPDECAVILRALPTAPHAAALAALDPVGYTSAAFTPTPAGAPPAGRQARRIVAFLGQTKKLRRPWHLAPQTRAAAYLGEVKLDLGVAQLPPRARLRVRAILGTATIYVPRGLRVRVRSTVLLGDIDALGEHTSGILTFGHEEHAPQTDLAAPEVDIAAFVLLGNVRVVLTDGPVVSIREMVGDALRAVAGGFRRGWLAESGTTPPGSRSRSLDASRPR